VQLFSSYFLAQKYWQKILAQKNCRKNIGAKGKRKMLM